MDFINPNKIRLVPGQSIEAMFAPRPNNPGEVGFFMRSSSGLIRRNGDLEIEQRAGLVKFDDVFLVLTMLRIEGDEEELFDIWWNYYAREGLEHFRRMAEQEEITIHFYNEEAQAFSVNRENGFRKFFGSVPDVIKKSRKWTDIEFDRAVRGFCAQSYPKENLWEMIKFRPDVPESEPDRIHDIEDYPEPIPDGLRPFYIYLPDKGHCIRIIPSMLEDQAAKQDPDKYLYPAPVKTVLRCGIRWMQGYPVAPIPFIPGHGLAVPPDDTEY
ncbi:MAG: hypothetical protein WBG50_19280 [Desulfomonilaceae bacterium]